MNAGLPTKDFVHRHQAWLRIQGLTGTIRTSLTPWRIGLLCWQKKALAGSLAGKWRAESSKGSWVLLQICARLLSRSLDKQGWGEPP